MKNLGIKLTGGKATNFLTICFEEMHMEELTSTNFHLINGGSNVSNHKVFCIIGYTAAAVLGIGTLLLGHTKRGWLNFLYVDKNAFNGYGWQGPIYEVVDSEKVVKVALNVNYQRGGFFYGRNPPKGYKKALDVYIQEKTGRCYVLNHLNRLVYADVEAPKYNDHITYLKEPIFTESEVSKFQQAFKFEALPTQAKNIKLSNGEVIQAKVISCWRKRIKATGDCFKGHFVLVIVPAENAPQGFDTKKLTAAIQENDKVFFLINEVFEEQKIFSDWPMLVLE